MLDAVSRYVLAVRLMTRTRCQDVRPVFEELFDRYGLPKVIQSDNGSPFASVRALAGLTPLSARWVSLGLRVVRSRVGHLEGTRTFASTYLVRGAIRSTAGLVRERGSRVMRST